MLLWLKVCLCFRQEGLWQPCQRMCRKCITLSEKELTNCARVLSVIPYSSSRSLIPQYQDLGPIILAREHLHAHARILKHTDLISTWKQILQSPSQLCAQLSWWLHLVYISLELNHSLERGCCLSQICSFPCLLLIRQDYWNNASSCSLKALQGERSRADMHTCMFRNKKQLSEQLSLNKKLTHTG